MNTNFKNKTSFKLINMSDEKPKKSKLRGFAAFINNIINSVKDKKECKDIIKGIRALEGGILVSATGTCSRISQVLTL